MDIYRMQNKAYGLPENIKAWELLFEYCRLEAEKDFDSSGGVALALQAEKKIRANAARQARRHTGETQRWMDLYWKTMLHIAQLDFDLDAFMLYMEKDRAANAKFWAPRRTVLEGKHQIASMLSSFVKHDDKIFLGLSMPPGTGKSTIIKFLMAYIAGKFPKSMNMYISYADPMAKMIYAAVQDIIVNQTEYHFTEVFPDMRAPKVSAEDKTISYRSRGDAPTIGFCSYNGSITGRTRANKFQITDDLVKNAEEARSPQRLENLNNDWRSTVTTRTIGDDVREIMLGTIWSAHDPLSRMRADNEGKDTHHFVAIPVWDANENSNFEFDHPDRYTAKKIRGIRDRLDPVDFSCLYLQRPIEKEGLAFPAESLMYYAGVLPDGEPDNIFFFCDVAWGGGDSLSMPIGYQYGNAVYVHDWLFDTGDKFITKPRVVGKILQHGVRMGRFEANNGGDEYCEDVDRMLRDEHGYYCNLGHKKAPTNMGKVARIEQHAPEIREIYFLDDAKPEPGAKRAFRNEDYRRAINETTSFSFTAKNAHDDAPDSLAGLCDYFLNRQLSRAEVFRRSF